MISTEEGIIPFQECKIAWFMQYTLASTARLTLVRAIKSTAEQFES